MVQWSEYCLAIAHAKAESAQQQRVLELEQLKAAHSAELAALRADMQAQLDALREEKSRALEKQAFELTGNATELARLHEEQEKEQRVEMLRRQSMRRLLNREVSDRSAHCCGELHLDCSAALTAFRLLACGAARRGMGGVARAVVCQALRPRPPSAGGQPAAEAWADARLPRLDGSRGGRACREGAGGDAQASTHSRWAAARGTPRSPKRRVVAAC